MYPPPPVTHFLPPSPPQSLHVRCDAHSAVEVTVAESGFTLQHANHASFSLKKRDAMHSHVFAASDPWDPFRTIVASAPVMRVKLTFLAYVPHVDGSKNSYGSGATVSFSLGGVKVV